MRRVTSSQMPFPQSCFSPIRIPNVALRCIQLMGPSFNSLYVDLFSYLLSPEIPDPLTAPSLVKSLDTLFRRRENSTLQVSVNIRMIKPKEILFVQIVRSTALRYILDPMMNGVFTSSSSATAACLIGCYQTLKAFETVSTIIFISLRVNLTNMGRVMSPP